jgi:sulfate adenylyltransferase
MSSPAPALIAARDANLVDLYVGAEEREELERYAATLPRITLTARNAADLELLANGSFSPLDRYMGRDDYQRVLEEMRLSNGSLFPIPITLSVSRDVPIKLDADVALVDEYNDLLALMSVEDVYEWDLKTEGELVYGTTDPRHCMISEMNSWGSLNISGTIRVFRSPRHHDFCALRLSPREVRKRLAVLGSGNVAAFQTRNPLHRGHQEMIRRALEQVNGTLLLHPVVGVTKPGDIDHYTRARSYKLLVEKYYDPDHIVLALLPLAMRMAGPREALWHAIIRKNYGATHFIVGRNHASPGNDSHGKPFYEPSAAQQLVAKYSEETGVQALPFSEFVYLPEENRYEEITKVSSSQTTRPMSGSGIRELLNIGKLLPEWMIQPEIGNILSEAHLPRERQGFCIWLTGLSCSGKSTTAEMLTARLLEQGRRVTLLDGDVVRTHLSKGLGFSAEDRDTNIRRIGFVAAEIVRHGGAVICAAVSPFRASRNECRSMVGDEHFIEVFVDCPLEICEQRDKKGMYALARQGKIREFTGIDSPYEPPANAEVVLDTVNSSVGENVDRIISYLTDQRFLSADISDSRIH